ncbi:putative uncharacterized protein DDB_G0286901 [Teleopsis dalmanni]|uniref:putative uncharacterized protein DDB_G0286901 n=1 Tax=Teleopsis dalmanni TaxID=139649 RepID=UPI0018CD5EE4|nr:putative uncharacterized protein DDB_G0286901 [Teleopsis dalmanni]
MSDIRTADLQGLPTRRQLYAQHRALSRAIMDSELHNLRKCGSLTLARLQELAKSINMSQIDSCNKNTTKNNCSSNRIKTNNVNKMLSTATSIISNTYSFSNNSHISHNSVNTKIKSSALSGEDNNKSVSSATSVVEASTIAKNNNSYTNNNVSNCNHSNDNSNSNIDVAIRVQKVALLFNEVDRASKRLEQLTEQRRERLRELTRQRALEDEVNESTVLGRETGMGPFDKHIAIYSKLLESNDV